MKKLGKVPKTPTEAWEARTGQSPIYAVNVKRDDGTEWLVSASSSEGMCINTKKVRSSPAFVKRIARRKKKEASDAKR